MNIDHLRALLSGERQEPVVIGHIYDPALVRVIRAARTHAVLLSRDNLVKQGLRHSDIGFEQYRLLPYVLRYGMVAQERSEQLVFCWHDHDGQSYRLMIKGTIRGEIFVESFHRLKQHQIKAVLARADILRKHA
jgi:hypothetical protein